MLSLSIIKLNTSPSEKNKWQHSSGICEGSLLHIIKSGIFGCILVYQVNEYTKVMINIELTGKVILQLYAIHINTWYFSSPSVFLFPFLVM